MSDELKNKFRDFEPEISEGHIADRWQKLVPHLPAGRRRIVPLWSRTLPYAAVAAAVIAGFVFFYPDKKQSTEEHAMHTLRSHSDVSSQSTAITPVQPPSPASEAGVRSTTAPAATVNDQSPLPVAGEPSAQYSRKPSPVNSASVTDHQQLLHSAEHSAATVPLPAQESTFEQSSTPSLRDQALSEVPADSVDGLMPDHLNPNPLVMVSPEPHASLPAIRDLQKQDGRLGGRLTIEAYAGAARYHNRFGVSRIVPTKKAQTLAGVQEDLAGTDEASTGITSAAALAARLKITRRIFGSSHLLYMGKQDLSTTTTYFTIANFAGGFNQMKQVTQNRSRYTVRAGAGLGCFIYTSPAFSIAPVFSAEYSHGTYEANTEWTPGTNDPATFTPTQQLPVAPRPQGRETARVPHWSACASLLLERKLTSALSITGRLQLHQDLRSRDVPLPDKLQLVGRQWFLALGAAYHFKYR